jgi:hypothetical protein
VHAFTVSSAGIRAIIEQGCGAPKNFLAAGRRVPRLGNSNAARGCVGSSRGSLRQGSEGGSPQSVGIALSLGRQVDDPPGDQESDAVLLVRQAEIIEDRLVGARHDGYDLRAERAPRLADAAANGTLSGLKLVHRSNQLLLRAESEQTSPHRRTDRAK